MKRTEQGIRLSASDLANHLACRHLTNLELARARGELEPPSWRDPRLDLLRERGFRHEKAYLEHLEAQGIDVVRLGGGPENDEDDEGTPTGTARAEDTLSAMARGAGAIFQATLEDGDWFGRADTLRRVEKPSELGPWSYEVVDTKLARETRAGTILQLCLYTDLVARMQGSEPELMHVVPPNTGFEPESYRFRDFAAYYRQVQEKLQRAVTAAPLPSTYPEPVPHCDICRWWPRCDQRRHEDDHPCLVAGISKLQISELRDWGVDSLEELAELPLPLPRKPGRGSVETYEAVREQARVQLEGRRKGAPVHELLPVEPERGLARLPEPSAGDIYFDIEGDPFVGTHGLEYLLGWIVVDPDGTPRYDERWAFGPAEERRAFEEFIDFVMERRERHPGLHVYHYAPYEPGALKRLMGRYATREDEVDRLLRSRTFVDLYRVVRQAIRASVESYSIKEMEPFYRFERDTPLRDASRAIHRLEAALELDQPVDPDDPAEHGPRTVRAYNREDCLSTLRLHEWLESLRSGLVEDGQPVPRPAPAEEDPPESVDEFQRRVEELRARLLAGLRDDPDVPDDSGVPDHPGVPDDPAERTPEQQGRWILAYLLDFHRREGKAGWWEYYRLADLDDAELLEEKAGLSGLEFVGAVEGGTARCPIHRYRYPRQDTDVRADDDVHFTVTGETGGIVAPDGSKESKKSEKSEKSEESEELKESEKPDELKDPDAAEDSQDPATKARDLGTVHAIDHPARTVDIKKRGATRDIHPSAVFAHSQVRTGVLSDALHRLGTWIAGHGMEPEDEARKHEEYRAARDLLLRRPPRLRSASPLPGRLAGPLRREGEPVLDAARRLVIDLDHGVLAIQGPPGSGKTYTGARMICDLVRAGKTVGVTALSHKVIRNLLDQVAAAAPDEHVQVRLLQKPKGSADPDSAPVREVGSYSAVETALREGTADVVGGTAWLWAREEFHESVDVLFIDEAGQMPLASVLAAAQAARNLVLLGDPQQLEQPQQGSHPDGTAVSALEHLLGGASTMPARQGLFLDRTWRLHDSICGFTSELFYEGRLEARPEVEGQSLQAAEPFVGAGLWYVPVEHEGNQSSSPEEADRVEELVEALLSGEPSWSKEAGPPRPLTLADILIVAPYNAQVAMIAERLPAGARVGTVDRFQGQEGAVVIYSMTTSSADDAPRGMEFLFSPNRLNVATSRARCGCILVASPRVLDPECRSPRQMRLANAFCRYVEIAESVS